ncbi:hypothetical protein [Actinomadura sp. NBRC 104425]|uniref:hypothetical protein n=1 Tax=Actinomadura sp. NBRC 104425 TaxID=3032204 RepID=UPI002555B40A|nr:hypothetical protein [Actinomadura sp. NBRC 104425]
MARDLRRRYAGTYRIVRAESGSQALASLRGLKLRGDDTAVLVADHRMPGMTGVEFPEEVLPPLTEPDSAPDAEPEPGAPAG